MVRDRAALSFFLILVVGGGLAVGYLTAPGEWYGQLAKPAHRIGCSGRFGQSSTF
jgi:hypothetical protein